MVYKYNLLVKGPTGVVKHIEAETNGPHFADMFKCFFLNENFQVSKTIQFNSMFLRV